MRRSTYLVSLVVVLFCEYAFAQPPSIQALGVLDPATPTSTAFGVSANGATVVGESNVAGNPHAFRWTASSGMVDLSTLQGAGGTSQANDVSDNGQVVVGDSSTASGFNHAFRWTSGGMVDLGTIGSVVGGSAAHAVSANGNVVVGDSDNAAGGTHAFRWTSASGPTDLGSFAGPAGFSTAQGVSDNGAVIVGYSYAPASSERRKAFRLQGGVMQDISSPAYLINAAVAVSGDGRFIGGIHSKLPPIAGYRASLRTPDGVVHVLPSLGLSVCYDVSGDGGVVVGTTVLDGSSMTQVLEATVWIDGQRRSLAELLHAEGVNLSQWSDLSAVHAISANGRVVVGYGTRQPSGIQTAFRAILPNRAPRVPTPAVERVVRRATTARATLSARILDPDSAGLVARWRVDGRLRETDNLTSGQTTKLTFDFPTGDTPTSLSVFDGAKSTTVEGVVRVNASRVLFVRDATSAADAPSEENSLATANGSSLDAYRLSGLSVGASTSESSLSGYRYAESAILAELYADETQSASGTDGASAYRQLRFAEATYGSAAATEHLRAFAETGDETQFLAALRWQMAAGEAFQTLTE